MSLTFGSLFAGIGGIDLGLERAGMECRWQVEIDPFCRKVLAKHWPDVPRYEDVCDVGKDSLEPVDLIAGGFPCQDISVANAAGEGIGGAKSGLWSEYRRIVREMGPRFVVVENVANILVRGIGEVLGDLAALGYDAEWSVLSACSLGAPHPRERVFVVAYPNRERLTQPQDAWLRSLPLPDIPRLPVRLDDASAPWVALEPGVEDGREDDGISGEMERARLGALGNAVVPQVAEWIGRQLLAALKEGAA